jgi:L-histidine N-alpha-methyltransferase
MNAKTLPIPPIAIDVEAGLLGTPKTLPPKLFYDARGSELFEQITALPEYYLTSTERGILERNAAEMISAAGSDLSVVELGAGSAAKTVVLLKELARQQGTAKFYPVDVSSAALEEADERLRRVVPQIQLHPIVADYTNGLSFLKTLRGRKLILYIGSSIGNFEPLEASAILSRMRASMRSGDAILLGTDMRKSPELLIPAYDDAAGVTAAFNKNVLARINRELGGEFRLEDFAHKAAWNPTLSRVEMHLESVIAQKVRIRELNVDVAFRRGETIHTENSYKFTMPMVRSIAENAGLTVERTWSDERGRFTVHLLRY